MDICELQVPYSIATASLDGTIVLYDLVEREIVRRLD